MLDTIANNWTTSLLLTVGLVYILIIQLLSKKEARPRKLSEAEMLVKLARMGPRNEYEIFHTAARQWRVIESRAEADFKTYLLEGIIPYYVNSYLRIKLKESGGIFRPPFILGGGSLPWLK